MKADPEKLRPHLWPQGEHAIMATDDQTREAALTYFASGTLQTYFEYPNPRHPSDPMKRLGYRLAFYPLNP